jgi:hypothetical protein
MYRMQDELDVLRETFFPEIKQTKVSSAKNSRAGVDKGEEQLEE